MAEALNLVSSGINASRGMATAWHQQVFALDAKYNTLRATKLPSLGTQELISLIVTR